MENFQHILIAEDDTDDYKFFIEALEKISPDFMVQRAKNGLECIKMLKENPTWDLIFLDLNMPYKNGNECLKFIKESKQLAEIPVIIYSTSHYIKDIDYCFKNGAQNYIVKPECGNKMFEILSNVFCLLADRSSRPTKNTFVIRIGAPRDNDEQFKDSEMSL
ncbi:MAG: Response regulator rcp1 [Segetibacter sp.]|nr:Response regulator rcp1 [Segetibacter sp.]